MKGRLFESQMPLLVTGLVVSLVVEIKGRTALSGFAAELIVKDLKNLCLLAGDECLLEAVLKRSAQRVNSCDVPSTKITSRP